MRLDEIDLENYESEFSSLCLRIFKFLIQNPLKFYFLQQYESSPLGFNSDELNKNREFPIPIRLFQIGLESELVNSMPLSLISNLVYTNISTLVRLQLAENVVLNRDIILGTIRGCWNTIKK